MSGRLLLGWFMLDWFALLGINEGVFLLNSLLVDGF